MTTTKNTKRPLAVGDRVAVYDEGVRTIGVITIVNRANGTVGVSWGGGDITNRTVHPKQCRRLVKKPRPQPRDVGLPAYRLLKDMPGLSAGTVFVHDKKDHVKGSIGCGCLKNAWFKRNCQYDAATDSNAWCAETHVLPGQLAENTEWFERIHNEGSYTV